MTESERDSRIAKFQTQKAALFTSKSTIGKSRESITLEITKIDNELDEETKKLQKLEQDKNTILGQQEKSEDDLKKLDQELATIDNEIKKLNDTDVVVG